MERCFETRALELHSLYAWDYEWIVKCLDFMREEGYNTLILHRNDFIDLIVYPGKYFGCKKDSYHSIFERYKEIYEKLYTYTPTRRSGPYQRRAFLKRVLHEASERNIDVYIENKELYFPDIILEFYPFLIKNGKICANDAFWFEFTEVKYKEFFEEFPEVAGIITAPATGESRISIKSNRCTCEICRTTPKEEWFRKLLASMYKPIHAAGKKLVVRDFVFDPQAHKEISKVMEELPEDVIISLKNTPHDYYPTFPENPRIGNVGRHKQWVEFDAMGQYFGWGIGIADLFRDYATRLRHAKEKGADGVIIRTDWESLDGHSAFGTLNLVNLYSMGRLSNDYMCDASVVYDRFLSSEGWYEPSITQEQRAIVCKWFGNILSKTWEITSKTVFIDGYVFSDSSLMPVSLGHAFWLAEEKNSLKAWDAGHEDVLLPTWSNLAKVLDEKKRAYDECSGLLTLACGGNPGLKMEKYCYLKRCLEINLMYVHLFNVVTKALVSARFILAAPEDESEHMDEVFNLFRSAIQGLQEEEVKLRTFFTDTDYHPHVIYTLLDPDRICCLRNDLQELVGGNND